MFIIFFQWMNKHHNLMLHYYFFLQMVLCGAFYPNFAIKEESDEGEAVKFLSNNDPSRTVMVSILSLIPPGPICNF